MTDSIIPIQAIWFTTSGQWEYAPPAPYDSKASYAADTLPTSLSLVTWNVDFAAPHPKPRLKAALDYIQFHAFPQFNGGQPPPCLILLQEIKAEAFDVLLAHPWIRAWFMVVPGSAEDGWPRYAGYGTVTLVARSAPLTGSLCVHFAESRMWRNALVTDVVLGGAEPHAYILRVANTHLESLPEGTSAARGADEGDRRPAEGREGVRWDPNGLLDAWEQRQNRDEDSTTWGYQPRSRFPPGRLDRNSAYAEQGRQDQGRAEDSSGVRDAERRLVVMKFALVSIASATLFIAGVSAQSLTINTPLNVVVCQPLLISWAGGTGPFFLRWVIFVHPGATPDGPALQDFGTQQGNSFTWTAVNFPSGTSLDLTLRDSAGITSQSAPFTVQTGTDTACLNASSSSSSSSGGSTSSTPVSTATATGSTPSVTTPTSSATTPTTSATTKPSSSPASSSSKASGTSTPSSSSSNAAMPTSVSYGAAGVIGVVVAAVLA
ncbi:hypothetical protein EDB83DRAFT_2518752 [Lactarius deliciosus]|nr:hypothetical protein EDB83DRAFT_2518752 [Lactarius deliciosus]